VSGRGSVRKNGATTFLRAVGTSADAARWSASGWVGDALAVDGRDEGVDIDWFWGVVEESAGSRGRLREILQRLPKDAVYKFQDLFLDFATELQDVPYSYFLDPDESEDGLEDVANWVVSQGRVTYQAVLAQPSRMPPHIDVDDPGNLGGLAYEVYYDRFGEPLNLI